MNVTQVFSDSVREAPWISLGLCGSAHPGHTDPLCFTFCSGHTQTHWPLFTFPPDSLLIRGLQDYTDWKKTYGSGGGGGGNSKAKMALSPFLSHTVWSGPAINNQCTFIVCQLHNALFVRNVNQRWVQWSLNWCSLRIAVLIGLAQNVEMLFHIEVC